MHDTSPEGELIFKCNFCKMPWEDHRPMVEGHRGSLICGPCLSIAFTELVHLDSGYSPLKGETCVLCLETDRDGLHWQSPIDDSAIACRRCIKQSAGVLHKDPDIDWKKPADPRSDG
jgi:hypothetical protein